MEQKNKEVSVVVLLSRYYEEVVAGQNQTFLRTDTIGVELTGTRDMRWSRVNIR